MPNLNCIFSEPVLYTGEPPASTTEFWQFKILDCTSTNLELIENPSTGANFYLDKSINYGDILVLTFLLLFAIFGIIKAISDFFLPKRIEPPHY